MVYLEILTDILNREPVQERDRIMMAMLRPPGIEKGKPLRSDGRQKKLPTEAAPVGKVIAKANDFDVRRMELSHCKAGGQWHVSLCLDPGREAEHYTQLEGRAAWFYEATTASKGVIAKISGVGQVHLGAFEEKGGNWLDGRTPIGSCSPPRTPPARLWSWT